MLTAFVLFAIGGSVGVYMVLEIAKNREVPKTAIIAHGIANTIGIVLVIAALLDDSTSSTLTAALILFVIAVGGGVILFYYDKIKKVSPPKILIIGHPLIAIAGVIMLVAYLGSSL